MSVEEVPAQTFGELLRCLRRRESLTQEELAERAGLAANAIGALERGSRRRPYPHTVRALVDALELDEVDRSRLLSLVPAASRRDTSGQTPSVPPGPAVRGLPPLIGRDDEVGMVVEMLRGGARLVTLTGPGGVGKTSLARAVATALAGEMAHGVVDVDLTTVRDPSEVIPLLARSLGLFETGRADPMATVVEFLAVRHVLLVLDNVEHVLGASPAVAGLVASCPHLRVVATSRAPLRVRAEREVPVQPLGVPGAGDDTAEAVRLSPAVAMLLERTSATGSPMELTVDSAPTIAEVCRRLEGLPLAIEMAAAHSRLLSPADLLARLDEALTTRVVRDLPARQQTFSATLEWSLGLLGDLQLRLFARLSVLPGDFPLSLALAVGPSEARTAGAVEILVEHSLLIRLPADRSGRTRLRMLEPVRQHAATVLAGLDPSEAAEAADRHGEYVAAMAAATHEQLRGPGLVAALDRLEADQAHLRISFERCVRTGRLADAVRLCWHLVPYLTVRGLSREWSSRLTGIDDHDLTASCRARLLGARGVLQGALGDAAGAEPHFSAALEFAASTGDGALLADLSAYAALNATFRGDTVRAGAILQGAERASASAIDPYTRILLIAADAQRELLTGDVTTAEERLSSADALARELANDFLSAMLLNMQATIAELRGDDPTAASRLAASVALSERGRLGWPLVYSLPAVAGVAMRLRERETAAMLLGSAAAHLGSSTVLGLFPPPRDTARHDVDVLRSALGDARFSELVDEGRALDLSAVVELADRVSSLARG